MHKEQNYLRIIMLTLTPAHYSEFSLKSDKYLTRVGPPP